MLSFKEIQKDPKDPNLKLIFTKKQVFTCKTSWLPAGDLWKWQVRINTHRHCMLEGYLNVVKSQMISWVSQKRLSSWGRNLPIYWNISCYLSILTIEVLCHSTIPLPHQGVLASVAILIFLYFTVSPEIPTCVFVISPQWPGPDWSQGDHHCDQSLQWVGFDSVARIQHSKISCWLFSQPWSHHRKSPVMEKCNPEALILAHLQQQPSQFMWLVICTERLVWQMYR